VQKQPNKRGRPKVEIDWDKVGKMLEAGCFATGIAATLGIDESTLYRRCPEDNKVDFSTYSQQKKAKGDELLRQVQYQTAVGYRDPKTQKKYEPDKTMLIWLGKQRLGQSDKQEIGNKDGEAFKTSDTKDLSKLSTEELLKLREINAKLNAS
jgi:hypothetical protein